MLGKTTYAIVVFTDVTEIKQVEQALRESEECYRILVEASSQAVWETNAAGQVVSDSPTWRAYTGQALEEWLGHGGFNAVHPDDREYAKLLWCDAVAKASTVNAEFRVLCPDGEWRWTNVLAAPIYQSDGTISKWVGMNIDITERKIMEQELSDHRNHLEKLVEKRTKQLERSERLYRTVSANIPITIDQYDNNLRLVHLDNKWPDVPGTSRIGKTWAEMGIPEEVYKPWQEKYIEARQTGKIVEFEAKIPKMHGETRVFLGTVVPELNEHGQCESLLVFGQDVTERKKMEAKIQHMDRLNLISEIAASIGHEVRNPMTTVRGYLQLFLNKQAFSGYTEQLNLMIEELDRANDIISEFLSLAKNKAIELHLGDLNMVIGTLFPLIQADALRMGHCAVLDLHDIMAIAFDQRELRQLILNLSRNALEAMAKNGLLVIRTYSDQTAVVLEFEDNGPGIPDSILQQIGKPFTTTKENGTGLGLAVCCRIAERHNAELTLQSSAHGTIVRVLFKA